MADRPALTVVIPTRNTRHLTLRCLQSLEQGGGPPRQVLLVDDGGDDGTAEVVEARFPTVTVLRNAERRGFAAAANHGLEAAEGALLLLLNSDTEVESGALDSLVEAFVEDPRLGVAGALLHYPGGAPQWSGGREPRLVWLLLLASGLPRLLWKLPGYRALRRWTGAVRRPRGDPRRVDWVTGAALAVRRSVLQEVGPLDERFRFYAQDLDFCLRVRDRGWSVCLLPSFRVLHHHGATIAQGRRGHSLERQPPAILWQDLVTLIGKRRGPRARRRAIAAVRAGAALRIMARKLLTPLVAAATRAEWREDTDCLVRALADCR